MLLYEAKAQIDSRLSELMQNEYRKHIPEYFEALEIASKCIGAQIYLADLLNDFTEKELENDTYSARLTYGLLDSCRFDKFENEDE